MLKFLRQSLLLLLPFIFVFIWQETLLSKYTLQTIGALVLAYLILSAITRREKEAVFFGGSVDVFIFTTIILMLVLATGNFSSGIFFLLYFLAFGIAFVFEPATVFVFVIYAVLLLSVLGYTFTDDTMGNYVKIGSLIALSPVAYFFGRALGRDTKKVKKAKTPKKAKEDIAGLMPKDVARALKEARNSPREKSK